jgi:hypothetical protein
MSQELYYNPYRDEPTLSHIDSVQNDYKPEADNPASPASHNVLRIMVTGLTISIGVLLLVCGLLVQIFAVHKFHFTSNTLVTSAPLGPTVAIAHACSVFVSITVPLVLGLAAYSLSRDWLEASRIRGDNRPTPFQ